MALQHRRRPQWGVQFHAESIASEEARALLRNFVKLTVEWQGRRRIDHAVFVDNAGRDRVRLNGGTDSITAQQHRYILDTDELPQKVPDEGLFTELFGSEPESVWLDGNLSGNTSSRFSIMGAPTGPLAKIATSSVRRCSNTGRCGSVGHR